MHRVARDDLPLKDSLRAAKTFPTIPAPSDRRPFLKMPSSCLVKSRLSLRMKTSIAFCEKHCAVGHCKGKLEKNQPWKDRKPRPQPHPRLKDCANDHCRSEVTTFIPHPGAKLGSHTCSTLQARTDRARIGQKRKTNKRNASPLHPRVHNLVGKHARLSVVRP